MLGVVMELAWSQWGAVSVTQAEQRGIAGSSLTRAADRRVLPRRPVILVPRSCGHRSRAAEIRRCSDLDLANVGTVDGIPVTGLARTLLDAAAGRSADDVASRIDACRRHSSLAIGARRRARPPRPVPVSR